MLKKEVCLKCFEDHHAEWHKSDEQCWRHRQDILCPVDHFKHDEISTLGDPPAWCKYVAAHGKKEQEITLKKSEISIEIDDTDVEDNELEVPSEEARLDIGALEETG